MHIKCRRCGLTTHEAAVTCVHCGHRRDEKENISFGPRFSKPTFAKRVVVCMVVLVVTVVGFYASLVYSADALTPDQRSQVEAAILHLRQTGFSDEAFLLENLAAFRATDNWLNASVEKENAYAATNFPFEIVTLYPDFFTYTTDDVERAAILLHEAKHLQGKDEKEAYEFVWKNRKPLGWTSAAFNRSVIWRETRKLTKENVPYLFACDFNDYDDCTESK